MVERGFDHFYNLEYDQAIADFQEAIAHDPTSPDLHNHLAQTLVFREMYRDGALESELVSGNNSFLRRPKLNPSAGNRDASFWTSSPRPWRWPRRGCKRIPTTPPPCTRWESPTGCGPITTGW